MTPNGALRVRSTNRLGPPPYWLYGLILLLDILILAAALGMLTELGDSIEDLIWPGGTEWID